MASDHPITSYKSFLKPLQFRHPLSVKKKKKPIPFPHLQIREVKQLHEEPGFELLRHQPIQESEVEL